MMRAILLAAILLTASAVNAQAADSCSWYFIDGSLNRYWVQYGPFHSKQQCEAVRAEVHRISRDTTSSCWHV